MSKKQAIKRRLSREIALQLLFQMELSQATPLESALAYKECFDPEKDQENGLGLTAESFASSWPLAMELFLGAAQRLEELDAAIAKAAVNWRLDRMSSVDLSLIRLAFYEMRFRRDIPPKVSLNEVLEIAKNYGDADSTAFINGVLDRLLNGLPKEP
ncbi:MAG: transcription antitermination factor NusB [Deltaproteobacteria bacterium]|jgi:N utilization substance protein B|nr:transcription antitermination factor NusB [Deltaproteobacteria bacterium]